MVVAEPIRTSHPSGSRPRAPDLGEVTRPVARSSPRKSSVPHRGPSGARQCLAAGRAFTDLRPGAQAWGSSLDLRPGGQGLGVRSRPGGQVLTCASSGATDRNAMPPASANLRHCRCRPGQVLGRKQRFENAGERGCSPRQESLVEDGVDAPRAVLGEAAEACLVDGPGHCRGPRRMPSMAFFETRSESAVSATLHCSSA